MKDHLTFKNDFFFYFTFLTYSQEVHFSLSYLLPCNCFPKPEERKYQKCLHEIKRLFTLSIYKLSGTQLCHLIIFLSLNLACTFSILYCFYFSLLYYFKHMFYLFFQNHICIEYFYCISLQTYAFKSLKINSFSQFSMLLMLM